MRKFELMVSREKNSSGVIIFFKSFLLVPCLLGLVFNKKKRIVKSDQDVTPPTLDKCWGYATFAIKLKIDSFPLFFSVNIPI